MTEHPLSLEDRNSLFLHNTRLLPRSLREQIQRVNLEEVWKRVKIAVSQDGHVICSVQDDEHLVHINSRHPLQQAQIWSNQLPLHLIGTLFVFGCGFGYPLLQLFEHLHKDSKIIVFEEDIYIFTAMLHYFDFKEIVATNKFVFFVGKFPDFATEFQEFLMTSNVFYLTAPSVVYTPSSRVFKRGYLDLQHQVFESLLLQIFKFGNNYSDSLRGFHNMIDNTHVVVENPYVSSLKNKFHNTPAFIVANGPSLDKNLHELKKAHGKGLILCCESAIIPLMKNGITPDAIVVAERDPESYLYHFQNTEYPRDIALLALAVADPRTFASFHGPKIPVFRSLESTSMWFSQLLGDGSGLFGGINVSHLAYETAVYLGANPIVFVGLDLAYGNEGVSHSKQSKYADEGQDYIAGLRSFQVVYVEGNDEPLIPSILPWDEYRKELERLIEQNPHITVVNATEGGAKIHGAKTSTLASVIEHHCVDNLPYQLTSLINEEKDQIDAEVRKGKMADLLLELKKYSRIYRALGMLTLRRKTKCERLMDALEQTTILDMEQRLNREYEQNSKDILAFLRPDLHNFFFLQVILHGYHQINEMGAINSTRKILDVLLIQFELFDHLNIICESLVQNFQTAINKLVSPISYVKHKE